MEYEMDTAAARRERRLCLLIYAVLMVLLVATMGATAVDLGWGNTVVNLTIAALKTGLILWVFMHLREMTPMLRMFAVAAVFWIGILFILGLGDWITR